MRQVGSSAVFIFALSIVGCGSSDATPPAPAPSNAVAGCGLHTTYAGDETCLPVPAADVGMQFHYGPSDYSNPDEVGPYMLQPTEESLDCTYLKSPNDEKIYFREFKNSLRPGSHHMIVSELTFDVAEGHGPCVTDFSLGVDGGTPMAPRLVGGSSVARGHVGAAAPEDDGLADYVEAHSQIEMTLHFINTGSEPLLREAWMNVTFMDPAKVKQVMEPIQGLGDVGWAIPPGEDQTWRSTMTAPFHMRVVDLYSHFHANTARMTAWKVATSGERTKLYETYNWDDPGVLPLNSVDHNPAPDATARTMGGTSGILEFEAGDKLEWECEVHNRRTVTLTYSNKALDGEMCNVRGNYAPSTGQQWFGFDLGHQCTGPTDCPE